MPITLAGGGRARGRRSYLTNRNMAWIGDSLTERAFGSTPFYWQNALSGAPLKLLANSGHSGQSVFGLIGQIDSDYKLSTAAGFDGLPPLGVAFVRIGTNTYRFGASFTTTGQNDYISVLNKALTYAEHVLVFPVPPIGEGITVEKNTVVPTVNAWLQSYCESESRLHWVDDCSDLTDVDGNVLTQFFASDMLHMNGAGSLQMAITGKTRYEEILLDLYGPDWQESRLVTDSADVYPAQDQWTTNPTNVGTDGTFGSGWSGTLPTGWRVETNGAGLAGVCSIVSADVGDPNQVPWVRIKPSQSASANIAITMTGAGRTISSTVPDPLEQMIEVRGNNFVNFNDLNLWLQAGGQRLTPNARLRWGDSIGLNVRGTLQQEHYRTGATSGSPTNYIYIAGTTSASGEMGSIDLRCWSVRG